MNGKRNITLAVVFLAVVSRGCGANPCFDVLFSPLIQRLFSGFSGLISTLCKNQHVSQMLCVVNTEVARSGSVKKSHFEDQKTAQWKALYIVKIRPPT